MIIVTGGAGFIGSNIVAALEARGEPEVLVCDSLGEGDKWRNIAKRDLMGILPPESLFDFLEGQRGTIDAVLHMGAISSTTATDADLVIANNVNFSLKLWEWSVLAGTRFIYASSAATYGDGSAGFDDDDSVEGLRNLRPLNLYGWSKHLFDRRIGPTFCRRATDTAAMGGPEVLQRVRPQRISQRIDAERRPPGPRTDRRRWFRAPVPLPRFRTMRTVARCAISCRSMIVSRS